MDFANFVGFVGPVDLVEENFVEANFVYQLEE